jgi:hypothetical protein
MPNAGPSQVLAYLARYTHRVAISNSRLISLADNKVSFRWKDYRCAGKSKMMTLAAGEFMRRFLMHTLPDGFHRIRHIGFLANGHRTNKLALCRKLLEAASSASTIDSDADRREMTSAAEPHPCPCCGGRMIIVEAFDGTHPVRSHHPRRLDGL